VTSSSLPPWGRRLWRSGASSARFGSCHSASTLSARRVRGPGPVWRSERRLRTSSSFRWCRLWSLGWQGRRPCRDAVLGPVCVLERFGCRSGGSGRGCLLVECRLLMLGRKSRQLVWDAASGPVCHVVSVFGQFPLFTGHSLLLNE
jgi:hypothetical protein